MNETDIAVTEEEDSLSPEIPFEADESILGDPPEGELTVFEAQQWLAPIVWGLEAQELWKNKGLIYIYRRAPLRGG